MHLRRHGLAVDPHSPPARVACQLEDRNAVRPAHDDVAVDDHELRLVRLLRDLGVEHVPTVYVGGGGVATYPPMAP